MVFIIDHIQHLTNESKMLTFAYINDRRVYLHKHEICDTQKPRFLHTKTMISAFNCLYNNYFF